MAHLFGSSDSDDDDSGVASPTTAGMEEGTGPPTTVAAPSTEAEEEELRGAVELFAEDQQKLPPQHKTAYICLLAYEAVDGFSLQKEPYISFITGDHLKKGYKKKLQITKTLIGGEIKRRDPQAQTNVKNKTVALLCDTLKTLYGKYLTEKDKTYIIQKEQELQDAFNAILAGAGSTDANTAVRICITSNDRLRLAAMFDENDVKAAYIQSQIALSRTELDARHSLKTFGEVACARFNNEEWIANIPALPNLHGEFASSQCIGKGRYTLTIEKLADQMLKQKGMLFHVRKDFCQSGNGENQLGEEDETHELKDGGKRSAFLRGKPSDILYWWFVMENNDLLSNFFAEMGDAAVNGDQTPPSTAKKVRSRKRGKGVGGNNDAGSDKKKMKIQRRLLQTLEETHGTMTSLTVSDYTNQLRQLQRDRFDCMKEIRKYKTDELFGTEPDSDDDWYKSLTERKLEIDKSIKDTQNSIERLSVKMDGMADGKESDSDDANIDDLV